jgi:CheY-like chemotaxis protein
LEGDAVAEDANKAKTLLVVEDNAVTREGLLAILRRSGYAVDLAGDGREALDYLDEHPPPDLILLDMLLPILDGWQFLEKLKKLHPQVPVVVTTGTDAIGAEWAAAHGCAGFLRKPIELEPLLTEIRRCLG